MSQVRQQQQQRTRDAESAPVDEVPSDRTKGEQLKADIDAILDEVDAALMENAEQFVREYRQKGGQ